MESKQVPTFEQFHDEWLKSITEGKPSTVQLGNRFSQKLLTQWLDLDQDADGIVYCDGSGDGGIDLAFLFEGDADDEIGSEAHTWYLVQSKYGKAFQGESTLLKEGMKVIETLDNQQKRLSSLTQGLIEQLSAFKRRASERDKIILVFATENPLSNSQASALKGVRAMGKDRLGSIFDVESVSIDTIYRRTLEDQSVSSKQIKVPLIANLPNEPKDSDSLLVCSVSLMSLYKFLEGYQEKTGDIDQIYEKNVRRFLGGRGKVNSSIQKTLKEAPEQFGFYNNGITLVVTDFKLTDNAIRLTDPYIVNGCQTTRSIWDVFRQRIKSGGTGIDSEFQTWLDGVERGIVVTKIVKVGEKGEELLQKITRFTNSQNAIKEKDFLALVSDFQIWKQEMDEKYGIFLEIQRGGWDSQKAYQKQHPGYKQYTMFANAFDLLKVYGAGWMNEAGSAFGRNAAFLPNGAVFKKIVNNEEEKEAFDAEDLYAAYQLEMAADKFEFGRSGKSTRKLTRHLFYNIVLELLKSLMLLSSLPSSRKDLTRGINKLFKKDLQENLLETALLAVDEYLTPGTYNSIFEEPVFKEMNSNLNGYLKSDQIGKGDIFKRLVADHARLLNRSQNKGEESYKEQIEKIIKEQID
ncbi:MAG TPA: AIPR family protein [Anaerolineales bacterium]|nr:AIPR family protein [Anaerolineales bacterium]